MSYTIRFRDGRARHVADDGYVVTVHTPMTDGTVIAVAHHPLRGPAVAVEGRDAAGARAAADAVVAGWRHP